jgi:ABC-type arginine/histidine transport system permease subunit
MEFLITLLWFIAYFAVGFVLSVVFRAYDPKPAKTDDHFYVTFIFLWPLMLVLWACFNGLEQIGIQTKKLAERLKPGSTEIKPKED